MLNRRALIKVSGAAALASVLPSVSRAEHPAQQNPFRYCLNTSTISGQKPGLVQYINIASQAGYDGVELWIPDIKEYLKQGNSVQSLKSLLFTKRLAVYNAISFTAWLINDNDKRNAALSELEEEMKLLAAIGCNRIAAPPAGIEKGEMPDWKIAGERYRAILELGRKHKVMPLLEFWGASGTLYNLGQALAIATAANDPDARILPDIYHMFRGGSGFEGLKLLNGRVIDIIHMNDYIASKPVEEQTDADRVYPGDGIGPVKQVLKDLKAMGGVKSLSLELFNRSYWQQEPLEVAKTGLTKMKKLVSEV
ncbi:MAG: sugar phosphate isomerase/epimerase [Chitinophagaceae bacterium]|nr:sugar phosphate isomerase/epimerase [Chitinophagaceae bacterium]